ncbi:ABC transporter substrate binding protein [Arcobacter sp. LA11]|uniref:sensor histidine kinase n=1 Tax=Arcobacter sp. LA11 TaxID=1898176 RepID=UPI000932D148|nr:ABC transporter substrate binding protein [Arcobacter sp. LA11]
MNLLSKILLLFILVFNTISFSKENKKILILHSYHHTFNWTDRLNNGIFSVLDKNDANTEYFIEYMDTKRFVNIKHYDNLAKIYYEKYKNTKFDLIISSDNNAFNFLKKYNNSIFKSVPVSFCGVNSLVKKDVENFENFTGTNEQADITKNIELIKTLHPNTNKIYIIIDTTTTGSQIKKQVDLAIKKYPNKNLVFEFISDITYNNLKTKVKNLPKNSVILLTVFFRDKDNNFFEWNDVSIMLSKNANVPVYSPWEFEGIIGGYSISSFFQGKAAGTIAKKILEGKKVKDIPIEYVSPNKYIFNYEKLLQHGINQDLLPKNSIIQNKPITFYEHYKKEIILALILFIMMFIFIIILLRNIQKRKEAEIKIKKQLKFQQDLIDNVDTPIYYKDLEGKYIGCNRAFENFINQKKENIMGKSIYGLIPKKFAKIYDLKDKELLKSGEAQRYEEVLENNEKETKHLVFYKNIFYNEKQEIDGLIGVVFDITKIREYSLKLDSQNKELIEANKSRDDFLANMSHELKTPLNSINIISSVMMKNKDEKLNNEQVKNLKVINSCGQDLLFLINDVLDISKLEAGEIIINYQVFDFYECMNKLKNMIEPQATKKGLTLVLKYESDVRLINSDEQRIAQILKNLLSNALKFTQKGEIRIIVKDSNNFISICVEDDGIGIAKEKLDSIFDRFKQVDGSTSRIYGGTGLGLSICKELANLLKGSIDVQSVLNVGTKFILNLPKNTNKANEKENIEKPKTVNNYKKEKTLEDLDGKIKEEKKNILIFNNDPISYLKIIVKLKNDYEVTQINNEKDLFEELENKNNYSHIIIDTNNLNLEELEKINPQNKLILIVEKEKELSKNLLKNASYTYNKPLNTEDFIENINLL